MKGRYGSIEAGGTKFVLAVGDEKLNILKRIAIPTLKPAETIPAVIAFFQSNPVQAIGLGCFGPIDLNRDSPTYGYITSTPKLDWQMYDIVGALEEGLGVPVAFTTDVNAACYGEYVAGAGKGLASCVYYTIGTGIGGGAINQGAFVTGFSHPEMGHMLVHRAAGDLFEGNCPFHHNCLEGMASGPAIEKRSGEKGEAIDPADPIWEWVSFYIAQAAYNTALLLSPQKIILGGGVMKQPHILPKVKEQFQQLLHGYVEHPPIDDYIVLPALGDNPGTIGCLALATESAGSLVNQS